MLTVNHKTPKSCQGNIIWENKQKDIGKTFPCIEGSWGKRWKLWHLEDPCWFYPFSLPINASNKEGGNASPWSAIIHSQKCNDEQSDWELLWTCRRNSGVHTILCSLEKPGLSLGECLMSALTERNAQCSHCREQLQALRNLIIDVENVQKKPQIL